MPKAKSKEPEALKGDLKPVTVYLPDDLHRQLKHESVDREMSVSQIIIEVLGMRVRFHDHNPRRDNE